MKQVYVISNGERLVESLKRFLTYNKGVVTISVSIPHCDFTSEGIVGAFRQVADSIEDHCFGSVGVQGLRDNIAIVDLCDEQLLGFEKLNPIDYRLGWAAAVAMLVFCFPEMYWIFITPHRPMDSSFLNLKAHFLCAENSISKILSSQEKRLTSLFDPTKLRNFLRQIIKDKSEDQTTQYLPLRHSLAAAIDEEEAYTFFNGYTAYRIGFRSHVVLSIAMMKNIFSKNENDIIFPEQPSLLFEDIYLNFPDQESGTHYSDLCDRDREYNRLEEASYRVFVTVGHRANKQA